MVVKRNIYRSKDGIDHINICMSCMFNPSTCKWANENEKTKAVQKCPDYHSKILPTTFS